MPLNPNAKIALVIGAIGISVAAEGAGLFVLGHRNQKIATENARLQAFRSVPTAPDAAGGLGNEYAGSPSPDGQSGGTPSSASPAPLSTPVPPPQNAEAKKLYDDGIAAAKAGDGKKALVCFQGALKLEPKNLGVLLNLARVYAGTGQPKAAIPYLQTLVQLAPKDAAAHFELARVLAAVNRLPEATAQAKTSIQLNPKVSTGYAFLAELLLAQKKPKDAYDQWKALAARDKQDVEARIQLARISNDFLHQPAQAEKWLREAAAIPSNDPRPPIVLSQLLMAKRKPKEAVQVLDSAVKRNPKNLELYPALAAARATTGDIDGAAGALKTAIQRSPDPASLPAGRPRQAATGARVMLQVQLGRLLGSSKHMPEAKQAFDAAIALAPNEPELYSLLARADLGLKDSSGAIKALTKALQLDQKRAGDRLMLAVAFARSKHWDKADDAFAAYTKLEPKDVEVYPEWAAMWMDAKQPDKAIEVWQRVLKIAPKASIAYVQIGSLYESMGKSDEAAASFKQAQKISPDDPNVLYELAKMQSKSDPKAAIGSWKRIVALQPEFSDGYLALIEAATKAGQVAEARETMAAAFAKDPEKPLKLHCLTEVLKYYDDHKNPAEAKQLLAAIVAKNPKAKSAQTALDSFSAPTSAAPTGEPSPGAAAPTATAPASP